MPSKLPPSAYVTFALLGILPLLLLAAGIIKSPRSVAPRWDTAAWGIPAPPPKPLPTAAPRFVPVQRRVYVHADVDVRSEPDSKGRIVETRRRGDVLYTGTASTEWVVVYQGWNKPDTVGFVRMVGRNLRDDYPTEIPEFTGPCRAQMRRFFVIMNRTPDRLSSARSGHIVMETWTFYTTAGMATSSFTWSLDPSIVGCEIGGTVDYRYSAEGNPT